MSDDGRVAKTEAIDEYHSNDKPSETDEISHNSDEAVSARYDGTSRPLKRRVGLKRSRLGCLQCRKRRKKCRLEKPTCKSCQDRNWICIYPTPNSSSQAVPTVPMLSVSPSATVDPMMDPKISMSSKSEIPIIHTQHSVGEPQISSANGTIRMNPIYGSNVVSCADDQNRASRIQYQESLLGYSDGSSSIEHSLIDSDIFSSETFSVGPGSENVSVTKLLGENLLSSLSNGLDPFSLIQLNDSERDLMAYFSSSISNFISYHNSEGPMARLILSLLVPTNSVQCPKENSLLQSAVCALASAHRSYALGITQDDQQLAYHTHALETLIVQLQDLPDRLEDEHSQNVLLTAIIVLIYYEIAKGGYVESIYMHLNGAYRIITAFLNHIIDKIQDQALMGNPILSVSKTTIFLFRTFQYFDVIFSLSKKTKLVDSSLQLYHFLETYERIPFTPDPTLDYFVFPHIANDIDPVMGLGRTLWPLMVRLTLLCNDANFGMSMTPDIIGRAALLELEISSWEVPRLNSLSTLSAPSATAEPSPGDLAHQASARVFQLASQIYLLRMFFPPEKVTDRIQKYARAALEHLAHVCTLEGNMATLLWPIFVVASECVDSIDRGFVRVVFMKLAKRQGMGNIMRSLRVVERIWNSFQLTDEDAVILA
ncbi:fungal-specific transcription factor domain-containing protein [Dipodascopsis uninucleata]